MWLRKHAQTRTQAPQRNKKSWKSLDFRGQGEGWGAMLMPTRFSGVGKYCVAGLRIFFTARKETGDLRMYHVMVGKPPAVSTLLPSPQETEEGNDGGRGPLSFFLS